jgi:hypothetical protein
MPTELSAIVEGESARAEMEKERQASPPAAGRLRTVWNLHQAVHDEAHCTERGEVCLQRTVPAGEAQAESIALDGIDVVPLVQIGIDAKLGVVMR